MSRLKNLNWKKYFLTASPILLILFVGPVYWVIETYLGGQQLKKSNQLLLDAGVALEFTDLSPDLPPAGDNFAEYWYTKSYQKPDPITAMSLRKVDHDRLSDAIHTPYEWNIQPRPLIYYFDLERSERQGKLSENRMAAADLNIFGASLAIEGNDREAALFCLKKNLHLVKLCNSDPSLLSLLIKVRLSYYTETIILMGMKNGLWQATDYHDFIKWLPPTKYRVSEATKLVNGEIIFYRKAIEFYMSSPRKKRKETIAMFGLPEYELWHFAPKGSLKYNIAYGQESLFYDFYMPLKQMDFSTTPPYSFPSENKARTSLAVLLSGSSEKLKTILAQSLVHEKLVRLACAIKLFELETGELPDSLAALAPKYINDNTEDLMNPGHSLIYRIDSKAKKHWKLYSVGQNLTDDGGKPEWDTLGKRDFSKGDWVVSMPLMRKP